MIGSGVSSSAMLGGVSVRALAVLVVLGIVLAAPIASADGEAPTVSSSSSPDGTSPDSDPGPEPTPCKPYCFAT